MAQALAARFGGRGTYSSTGLALSEDDIRRIAPSVYAAAPHASRSARYAHIPTADVVRGLGREGFKPFFAAQGLSRVEGKADYTKHMLRFRHETAIVDAKGGGAVNEIILINSHDGTSSYQMLAGCFRFVCSNGLVCGTTIEDVRIKHTGRVVEDVIQSAFRILGGFDAVDAQRDAFQGLQLTSGEQAAFADAALALRFADKPQSPVTVDQVLTPRRYEDRGSDLWSTFNVVQENVIQGGLRTARVAGQPRRTTRAVTAIDGSVALNRALWVLAERLKEHKAAA